MKRIVLQTLLTVVCAGFGFGHARGQSASGDAALQSATELAKKIQQATGAKKPEVKVADGDPCAVLSLADVRKAFPKAQAGERNRRLEQYGATECAWKGADGQVVLAVQERFSAGTAQQDVQGMAMGLTDPLKPASARNVRYELFPGIGSQAVAFVEAADAKRGILSDWALLSIRRETHAVWLMSDELPLRDRSVALKVLEDLGRVAAKRLE
jgi:hypothetical protein